MGVQISTYLFFIIDGLERSNYSEACSPFLNFVNVVMMRKIYIWRSLWSYV
jgi:hypothetical protein